MRENDNDMNNIPVLIHHETGEKKQKGGEKNQKYLYYTIKQAEKEGNQVVLFGDEYNRDWCSNWYDASTLESERWKEFEQVFENMSTYPTSWAKGIFKRFFIIEEYLKDKDIDKFILLDSDVLVYLNFSEMFRDCDLDLAYCEPYNQDFNVKDGKNMRMVANVGVSYWTKNALSQFIDFCIQSYRNKNDLLEKKWHIHQREGYAGGVNEMTLVYLWVHTSKNLKYKNLCVEQDGRAFMHNYLTEVNYFDKEFIANSYLGYKKVKIQNGMPIGIRKKDGSQVIFYNIHFVGDSKRLEKDFYEKQRITCRSIMLEYIYATRNWMAKIVKKVIRRGL